MVVWSALAAARIGTTQCRSLSLLPRLRIVPRTAVNNIQVRTYKSTGGTFHVVPSNFQWNKFKDLFNFYLLVGLIPALSVILYVNIFIGPATLTPIPEGYKPKHWEYHSHPITRFISKYITGNPQKYYEKMCFVMFYRQEERYARKLQTKVKNLIANRRDFQSWYYSPAMTKYRRETARLIEDYHHRDKKYETFPMHF